MDASHTGRPGLNLLDGDWYADDPHEVWRWMRRHGARLLRRDGRRLGHLEARRCPCH